MAQPAAADTLNASHAWYSGLVVAATVPSDGTQWKDWVGDELAARGTDDANYSVSTVSGVKRAVVASTGGVGVSLAHRAGFRLASTPILFFSKFHLGTTNPTGSVVQWWDSAPFGNGWYIGGNGFGNLFFRSNANGRELDTGNGAWNDASTLRSVGMWFGATGAGKIYLDGAPAMSVSAGVLLGSNIDTNALRLTLANGGYESTLLSTVTRSEAQADADMAALHTDQFTAWGTPPAPPEPTPQVRDRRARRRAYRTSRAFDI